ncbi:MAG: transcriptional regulator [Negativicutes bacterium]|nr:transcriptional regulator [Negativicutes bacterium]
MKNKAIGSNWADVRKAMFTSEEIAASDARVAVLAKAITAKKKANKKQLES